MKITTVGLDLAKTVFQVHGADSQGRSVVRKQLRRNQVMQFFVQLEPCLVAMEACGSAHHWARQIQSLGHEVRLIPPQYVKPYVKTNKTDAADAEAICEAVRRPNMHFVPVKTVEQQAVLSLHRARAGFMKVRTATGNHIRGLLQEFGIVVPKGQHHLTKVRETIIGRELPGSFQELIELQMQYLRELEARIAELDRKIGAEYRDNEAAKRLAEIPGVGILTATAMVASVGDGRQFRNGRQLAGWLGLLPRQHSTGGKARLLGISKRGDSYLRTLLVHGGRSVLHHATQRTQGPMPWHVRLMHRRHKNVAAVALAHKNARTIWALLAKNREFDPQHRNPQLAVA